MNKTIVFLVLIIFGTATASAQTTDCPEKITFGQNNPTTFAKLVNGQWEIDVLKSLNNTYCFFDKKPHGLDVVFSKNGVLKKIARLEIEFNNNGWSVTPIQPQIDWKLYTVKAPYYYYKKIEPMNCDSGPSPISIKFDKSHWVNGGIAPSGINSTAVKLQNPDNSICYTEHSFVFNRIIGSNGKFNAFFELPLKTPSNKNMGIAQMSIDHDYSHQGQMDHFKLFIDNGSLDEFFTPTTQPTCQAPNPDPQNNNASNTCTPSVANPTSPPKRRKPPT